jgi:hypothetical protein
MQTVIDRSTAEQEQARRTRRESAARVREMNEAAFQHALITLQMCIKSEGHAVQVLHGISSALAKTAPPPNSDLAESIGWIDELADQINYRNQP